VVNDDRSLDDIRPSVGFTSALGFLQWSLQLWLWLRMHRLDVLTSVFIARVFSFRASTTSGSRTDENSLPMKSRKSIARPCRPMMKSSGRNMVSRHCRIVTERRSPSCSTLPGEVEKQLTLGRRLISIKSWQSI
jgi:hypothetical protein